MERVNKLKGLIVEKGTSQEKVARAIGMDRSTFYRKMRNGGVDFTIGEIERIVKELPLTHEEAKQIFFASIVA